MDKNDFIKTLEAMGASDAEIAEVVEIQYPDETPVANKRPEIQPANVLVVELFFTVCRYWNRVGMDAHRDYLDPLKVEARASKMQWYKRLDDDAMELLWYGLDIMETTCLNLWAQQQKQVASEQ